MLASIKCHTKSKNQISPLLPHPHPHPQPVQYQWLFLLDSRLVHLFKLTEKKMQTADKATQCFYLV